MILVDANILMYAAGAPHPNKVPSVRFLEEVAAARRDAVIDAEILQEILHRYRGIGRWEDGRHVYDAARRLFAVVIPVTGQVLDEARSLLDEVPTLSARDALHGAVVRIHELDAICSFDTDFDDVPGIRRVVPA